MRRNSLHLKDAVRLLRDGGPHDVVAVKADGELLTLHGWELAGGWQRGGTLRLVNPRNGEIRAVRKVCLLRVDRARIYW